MEYRGLGRTGMLVSEVGFGCGNVGGLLVRGSEAEQAQAVKRAMELGINYFDTAPAYGDGRSEAHLGLVLRQLNADVFVATKFRVAPEEWRTFQERSNVPWKPAYNGCNEIRWTCFNSTTASPSPERTEAAR